MYAAHEPTASFDPVAQLGDDELIASTQRLLREERKLTARLLVHLAEVCTNWHIWVAGERAPAPASLGGAHAARST
jgi:hypothetical protein